MSAGPGAAGRAGARREWHAADWGPLGWAETALKGAGAIVGVGALVAAGVAGLGDGPEGARLAQVVLLGLLSLGLVAGIADRVVERETVAMAFILVMNAGHWSMAVALAGSSGVGEALLAFAGLMLAGDLVKLAFIARSGFRVRDLPRRTLVGLTAAYAIGYAALITIELAA